MQEPSSSMSAVVAAARERRRAMRKEVLVSVVRKYCWCRNEEEVQLLLNNPPARHNRVVRLAKETMRKYLKERKGGGVPVPVPVLMVKREENSKIFALWGKGFSLQNFITVLLDEDLGFSKLENYFTWMLQLDGLACLQDPTRLDSLSRKIKSWIKESEDQYHLSYSQKVTQKMVLGLYDGLCQGWTEEVEGYFKDAGDFIEKTEENVEEKDPDSPREPGIHRPLCRFIWSSSKSILHTVWMFLEGSRPYQMMKEAVDLMWNTQSQMLPEGKNARLALVAALKGNFANQLGHTSDSVMFFKQASSLNPNYFDWTHHHYTQLRKARREANIHKSPSQEEIDVCTKAFSLCPEYWRALNDMANLVEDKNREGLPSEDFEKNKKDVVNYLIKARKKAPNNITVALKCVEVMSAQKGGTTFENIAINEEILLILDFCQEKWPNNSQVFHKCGKYHALRLKDKTTALAYFQKSLDADPTNFPCLMDYLRLKLPGLTMSDGITLLLSYLPHYIHKPIFSMKLFIIIGYCKYLHNDIAGAIRAWIEVFYEEDKKKLTDGDKTTLRAELKRALEGRHSVLVETNYGKTGTQIRVIQEYVDDLLATLSPGENNECAIRVGLEEFGRFLMKLSAPRFGGGEGGGPRTRTLSNNYNNNNRRHRGLEEVAASAPPPHASSSGAPGNSSKKRVPSSSSSSSGPMQGTSSSTVMNGNGESSSEDKNWRAGMSKGPSSEDTVDQQQEGGGRAALAGEGAAAMPPPLLDDDVSPNSSSWRDAREVLDARRAARGEELDARRAARGEELDVREELDARRAARGEELDTREVLDARRAARGEELLHFRGYGVNVGAAAYVNNGNGNGDAIGHRRGGQLYQQVHRHLSSTQVPQPLLLPQQQAPMHYFGEQHHLYQQQLRAGGHWRGGSEGQPAATGRNSRVRGRTLFGVNGSWLRGQDLEADLASGRIRI